MQFAFVVQRIAMSVQNKIKEELLKEIYTDIDKMYDFMAQHFVLAPEHEKLVIKHLNKLKDQFHLIAGNSRLS
jgi:flagellin-specific chaperone FliS